jgi:hypothetical protein
MKKNWRWVLGILIVLVIVAVPFILHYTLGYNFVPGLVRNFNGQGPMMSQNGWNGRPPGQEFNGFRGGPGQMMVGRRSGGFFGPFLFLGGLLKLVFFGALLYGAYWLGKRNARVVLSPAPVAPSVPEAEPDDGDIKRERKVA